MTLGDSALEETICRALSLDGHEVTSDGLHACHRLKTPHGEIHQFNRHQKNPLEIENLKDFNNTSF